MPNMDSIVKAHNTKILKKKDEANAKEEKACNCRDKASCPVGNDRLKTNVVYKATVQHENKISNYIGMTENSFNTRYTQHKSSLKHSKNRTKTELSSLIWSLKDHSTPYTLAWHIIDHACVTNQANFHATSVLPKNSISLLANT